MATANPPAEARRARNVGAGVAVIVVGVLAVRNSALWIPSAGASARNNGYLDGGGGGIRVADHDARRQTGRGFADRQQLHGQHGGNAADGRNLDAVPALSIPESRRKVANGLPAVVQGDESRSITPIDVPFLQSAGEFNQPGHGISLESHGEPKSGTTWLGRLVPTLALDLCGAPNNQWCEMGGLEVNRHNPAPWYEFEMLKKSSTGGAPTLFLHFNGWRKHIIIGMEGKQNAPEDDPCRNGGHFHKNGFEDHPVCNSAEPPTRESLQACLWSTTSECLEGKASRDPSVRRTIVIFRDPRDVVLSAYKMRSEFLHQAWVVELSTEEYIRTEFENLVSWIHQRWMWHTSTVYAPSSHVVYYEEAQESYVTLIGMAAFMGLECTREQAYKAWKSHQSAAPHRNFRHHDLSEEILQFMDDIMGRLLPPSLARRWGVIPIESTMN